MDFPIHTYMDEQACYDKLVEILHPKGLACPRCGGREYGVHRRHRAPALDYRCRGCRRVFNAYTGSALQKTQRPASHLLLILRGIAQGTPTAKLARELGCDRVKLLELRHRIQRRALDGQEAEPLDDAVCEADETFVNAGEKRHPARLAR